MNPRTAVAALITAASVTVPVTPAFASSDGGDAADTAASGCVTDATYSRLGLGQTLSRIRSITGNEGMVSQRDWASGANAYKERVYAMCTPIDSAHDQLTTRFMYYQGAWRAFIVDTLLGPEPR
jgi:hypothetical protein